MKNPRPELLSSYDLTLQSLCDRYPNEWPKAQKVVCEVLSTKDFRKIFLYHQRVRKLIQKFQVNDSIQKMPPMKIIHAHMQDLALSQYFQALKIKNTASPIRIGIKTKIKTLIQRLWQSAFMHSNPANLILAPYLSSRRFNKKPLWHSFGDLLCFFASDKANLYMNAYKAGVYCIFTEKFIYQLSLKIGKLPCLEIGSGDGTLAKYLSRHIPINATDNYSWSTYIDYNNNVENIDAIQSLKKYTPKAVICCWPPPKNIFESRIFDTQSVEIYIVIGSKHKFATGNFTAYCENTKFSWSTDLLLTKLLLPNEIDGVVYIFSRL